MAQCGRLWPDQRYLKLRRGRALIKHSHGQTSFSIGGRPVSVMRRRPEVTPVVILINGGIKDRSCVEYLRRGSSDWSFGSLAERFRCRRWAICEWVRSLDCRLPMTAISVLYVASLA
jgi:hypothetical protein